jgi:signal peptidase II
LRRTATVWPLALAATGAVVAIDQATKWIATSSLEPGERSEALPFLAFEISHNEGVAFGLGGDVSALVIAAELVLLSVLLYWLAASDRTDALIWLPIALLVGGALGNLADRARDDAVIDFIDLPLWPTFNLADMAIVAGVFLLVIGIGRQERAEEPP